MAYEGLILLPGMMCDARLFAPQIEALGDFVRIECPSFSTGSSIPEIASRILNQTAFETFALAGLSMGGIVAMEMVRQAGHRVERLALLDTNHLPDAPERVSQRMRQTKRALSGDLAGLMMEELKPFYVAPQHMGDPSLNAIFMAMAEDLGPDVFSQQAKALIDRSGSEEVLQRYEGRTLVLCGLHDLPCPVVRHEAMDSALPNSELVVVPDAGHIPTLENPEPVNIALRAWLNWQQAV